MLQRVKKLSRFNPAELWLARNRRGVIMPAPKTLKGQWSIPAGLESRRIDGQCDTYPKLCKEVRTRLKSVLRHSPKEQKALVRRATHVVWQLRKLFAPPTEPVDFRITIQHGRRDGASVAPHCDPVKALMYTDAGAPVVLYLRKDTARFREEVRKRDTVLKRIPRGRLLLADFRLAHGSPCIGVDEWRIGYVVHTPLEERWEFG